MINGMWTLSIATCFMSFLKNEFMSFLKATLSVIREFFSSDLEYFVFCFYENLPLMSKRFFQYQDFYMGFLILWTSNRWKLTPSLSQEVEIIHLKCHLLDMFLDFSFSASYPILP